MKEQFCIPPDDNRFRILCDDGASYVAAASDSPEVLLVDGFDMCGQPAQLCSATFYGDCYRTLSPEGLLVVNLCGPDDQQAVERIRDAFGDRVLMVTPEDGENKIVFAWKGQRFGIDDSETEARMKKFLLDFEPVSCCIDHG